MAAILDQVTSIVLVMMENRSFDHMLGHLTMDDPTLDINGLKAPLVNYNNVFNGTPYPCFARTDDNELSFDVPHEWNFVETQLAKNPVSGAFAMNGFVAAYAQSIGATPNLRCDPMGFMPGNFVPVTEWLASRFCVCDNWFCPIPTSTQPNRTMAFSGDTDIFQTKAQLISIPHDIFHWMDNLKGNVRWRVYHEGFSSFSLYPGLLPYVLGEQFQPYERLYADIQTEPASSSPQVTIIEPCYEDAPHLGSTRPDDNHAPLAVGWGEDFLRRTYQAISANAEKWAGTLMIIYYDEHGGFYDHQPPPAIPYTTKGDPAKTFNSMGPRVPAILVSPLIKPGTVCHELFDHTSVLQLLAEKFSPGVDFSDTVAARKQAGVRSVQVALDNPVPFSAPAAPDVQIPVLATLGRALATPPQSEMAQSFELAGQQMLAQKPAEANRKYPGLLQWNETVAHSPGAMAAGAGSSGIAAGAAAGTGNAGAAGAGQGNAGTKGNDL